MIRYADICSGISAASVAWKPLRWRADFYAEIEKFPSAVLARRYPKTPNFGDITHYEKWPDANLDVLVGGTPCQGFSIAGLRKGMDDDRSNLALYFGRIAFRYKPRWVVWENVPGVRSSNAGRDLGAFLGGLAELGYGLAWRSLDAQYAGLAQRRERMFVVGYLGDWRPAAAVLFEPESLRWDSPPRRETREGVAVGVIKGAAIGREPECGPQRGEALVDGTCFTLQTNEVYAVAHALRTDGFDASEDGTGRGTPIVPVVSNSLNGNSGRRQAEEPYIAFSSKDHGADAGEIAPTLRAMGHDGSHANAGGQVAVAFAQNQLGEVRTADTMGTLNTNSNASGRATPMVAQGWAVRRLTPVECERLMGFPDNYTRIAWRGKPAEQCPDGPRYKALGNSIDTHTLRWIGERIQLCDGLVKKLRRAA